MLPGRRYAHGSCGPQNMYGGRSPSLSVALSVAVSRRERSARLLSVQWVVSGVKVRHQFVGGGIKAGDELFDGRLARPPGAAALGPLLRAARGGDAGDFALSAHGRLHGRMPGARQRDRARLPARGQGAYALAQALAHVVPDQA